VAEQTLWFGRVDVIPESGNEIFAGAPGAFANVLALASGRVDYEAQGRVGFSREGLIFQGIDQIQTISRQQRFTITSTTRVQAFFIGRESSARVSRMAPEGRPA
jgi:hypothetical protein